MKKLFTLIIINGGLLTSFSQTDNWNSIETGGFGDVNTYATHELMVFKDTLYACMGHKFAGTAEIHRSGTGDVGDWQQVTYDASSTTVKGIPSISTYQDSIMWIATGNPTLGTVVYRTLNGTDWVAISNPGFGTPQRWSPTPNMKVYQGSADTIPYLYAAGNTHGGTVSSAIYRIPYTSINPSDWELVIDFNIRDTNCTQVTYFQTWNDTLYFGSNGDSLLYQTGDGMNFIASTAVQTSYHPADLLIACMEIMGGYFYTTTNNPAFGGKLYRSNDMENWEELTDSLENYDPNRDFELHNLDVSNGYIWITSYTDTSVVSSNGCPVWRSTDQTGSDFVQSNADGFGNSDNDGENSVTIGFNNRQYYGGPNYFSGAQIWRTDAFLSVTEREDCNVTLFPNPVRIGETLNISTLCSSPKNVQIYDFSGRLIGSFNATNSIDLSTQIVNEGLYILTYTDDDDLIHSVRFIVE